MQLQVVACEEQIQFLFNSLQVPAPRFFSQHLHLCCDNKLTFVFHK